MSAAVINNTNPPTLPAEPFSPTVIIKKQLDETEDYEKLAVDYLSNLHQYKDRFVEMNKNSAFVKYTNGISQKLLTQVEKQVQQISSKYQKENVQAKDTSVQENSIVKRLVKLEQDLNALIRLIIQEKLKEIKNSSVTQKALTALEQVKKNPKIQEAILFQQLIAQKTQKIYGDMTIKAKNVYGEVLQNTKVQEALIFREITQEFWSSFLSTKVLIPAIDFAGTKYSELKNQTTITMTDVKTKFFKTYVPQSIAKYKYLKKSSIQVYNDIISIKFDQEFYNKNSNYIQTELKEFYELIKAQQQKYNKVYLEALTSYKSRRTVKMAFYEKKMKEVENSDKDTHNTDQSQSNKSEDSVKDGQNEIQ